MKTIFLTLLIFQFSVVLFAKEYKVSSPDDLLTVIVKMQDYKLYYKVYYSNVLMLEDSPLGIETNTANYILGLKVTSTKEEQIKDRYSLKRIKTSSVYYEANKLTISVANKADQKMDVVFQVSNNNVGYHYKLFPFGETQNCIIKKEVSGFNFKDKTSTFLSPQATPGIGWKKTKPSYEEEYVADDAMNSPSKYGLGYTFPCLFHVGNEGWILVSETGVSSNYCASHLSEASNEGLYTIAFPDERENNGNGNAFPTISLPGTTPWRTITVGSDLKPIVETTIPFDLVEPLYEPSQEYKFGRSTWSWIMWQDWSMNYDDQVSYIDLAAEMGYEYILMDALWDKNIGYEKMETLIEYAQSKSVDVFLWYNSNGYWNNAPQGPKYKMDNSIVRKKEMKWLKEMGVKGLKVDFFGGDKQQTMRLYEDILSDANEYGLMIIFHGCTLPRGWEKMYPNFVGSEAVLASENLIFTQHANDMEAFNASLHPFIRNTVGSMEFGPVLLNKRHNRTNDGGNIRRTSDIFQLATAVLFQNPIQMFAIAPNNLIDVPSFEIDFMKQVPTTWDETIFIDGYPGRYCILARRHENKWYVVGINAQKKPLALNLKLPMLAGMKVAFWGDNKKMKPFTKEQIIKKSGETEITIQPNGGILLTPLQ